MDLDNIVARAAAADSPSKLADVLRLLRRREARRRQGPVLTYRAISKMTGLSLGSVCGYFAGTALAPADRFDRLVQLLGARPDEQGPLATARDRVSEARRVSAVQVVTPRALPPAVRGFTGRTAELAQLDGLLSTSAGTPVVISAIAGMGGVGKTALAVHWAHRVADRFPDGQLYVNLRGYDPVEPLTTWDALGTLLAGLGVSPQSLPGDLPGRAALYRRELAGRRVLVMLDNGRNAEQVRPLLPPAPCLALVTSRDALADLVAADGARRVTLDALPEDEAVALLRLMLGERADRESAAVHDLARRCGRLPLALRVVAERADQRRVAALADLTAEFDEAIAATPEVAGDHRISVRAVLSWSLRHLPAEVARTFCLLGLVPLPDIDQFGLAAIVGGDVVAAARLAHALSRAHLLQRDESGRWSMHDLLRDYATEAVQREVAAVERDAAVDRLMDYYLATAAAAVQTAFPQGRFTEAHHRPAPVWSGAVPEVGDVASAIAWLGRERANLVRASTYAAAHGRADHAIAFALTLRPFLDGGYDRDGVTVHMAALAADSASADPRERAAVRTGLAMTRFRLGELDAGAELAECALAEFTRLGSPLGMSRALYVLGAIRDWQGHPDAALTCIQRGLDIARSAGLRAAQGRLLNALGLVHGRQDRIETAVEYVRQAAQVADEVGDILCRAEAHGHGAYGLAELGQYELAATMAEEALVIQLEHGRPMQHALAMISYGMILTKMARYEDAVEMLSDALKIGRSFESLQVVAQVLNGLGETYRLAGNLDQALGCHAEALDAADRSGDRLEVATALEGLGDTHAAAGNRALAQEHWTRAYHTYLEMEHPGTVRVAEHLATTV